jgi:hypothetical protein
VVKRLINRLKQWRRVTTRFEKRATNYQAMLTLAAIMHWLCGARFDLRGAHYVVGVPTVGVAAMPSAFPAK